VNTSVAMTFSQPAGSPFLLDLAEFLLAEHHGEQRRHPSRFPGEFIHRHPPEGEVTAMSFSP